MILSKTLKIISEASKNALLKAVKKIESRSVGVFIGITFTLGNINSQTTIRRMGKQHERACQEGNKKTSRLSCIVATFVVTYRAMKMHLFHQFMKN